MQRPLLLYDADCGFCLRWIHRWQLRTGPRVLYRPARAWRLLRYGISPGRARRSVQFVEPTGQVFEGASAVFRTLAHAPGLRWISWLGRLPVIRNIADRAYRLIASHRSGFARLDRWLTGSKARPAGHARIRRWFFVALGATFFAAFTSMRRQVLGLYGQRGIRSIDAAVSRFRPLGRTALKWVPSVFLKDGSDRALLDASRRGQQLSVALALGIEPRLTVVLLWAYYLSFVSAGAEFLSFQWDILLLETALHAAVVAPPASRHGRDEEPGALAVALMRTLVFRLHFESGLVKFRSPDECWRDRTALAHYYETAPLPTRFGWYAHHLPARFQRFATSAALWIELVAPFMAFGPRRLRIAGFAALTGLQCLIALTGNYGFFNLLSFSLNLWMLDDGMFPSRRERPLRTPAVARALLTDAASIAMGALGTLSLLHIASRRRELPRWGARALAAVTPLHSVNTYGPFSLMTTTRPEIVVEGSRDGVEWRQYVFPYKIDDVTRPPRWVAPHQPRLDWQMWFAALGRVPAWFMRFVQRLLEGSPEVLGLLAKNPFADEPPRFLRATLYDYRMTSRLERRETGAWWKRTLIGPYLPVVQLG